MTLLVQVIHFALRVLSLLVFVQAVLTFFLSPYHPVRRLLDPLVEPLLAPIRRLLPTTGGVDFSPLILIIILQVLDSIVLRLFG